VTQGPGPRQVVWNGLDQDGRLVGAGVYVATLTVGGERKVRRFALAR
jgi:hypothetical protein